jgi:hypothetical protein
LIHYLLIFLLIYIGAFLCFPQAVLAFTVLLAAGLMNLVDWTTIPWSP